jgi:hypothetical protein
MVVAGLIVAILALLGTAATVVYAKRTAPPRLQLTKDFTVTPLLSETEEVRGRLEVRYGGEGPLKDPRVVQVTLHNTGYAAITKEMYEGDPYRVELGARVVDLLKETNNLSEHPAPALEVCDSSLKIGPGTIHRGQRLTYGVLVDGAADVQQISPFPDVDLAKSDEAPDRLLRPKASWLVIWAVSTGLALLLWTFFGLLYLQYVQNQKVDDPECPYSTRGACERWHNQHPAQKPDSSVSVTPSTSSPAR